MTTTTTTVSVLMAVYAGTPPPHLEMALDSVVQQTRQAEQVVVVVDGPVSQAHQDVLARFRGRIETVAQPASSGLGSALAAGLAHCSGEWVARADADDVNDPQRLERQLEALGRTGGDVCSAAMFEVEGESLNVLGIRRCPTSHESIARLMKWRNPVHHPAVVFRRELAVRCGGYEHLPFLEDYDLWARMLRDGARFIGLDEPLVRYRTDGMLERRADAALAQSERELQRRLRSYGVISRPRIVLNRILRGTFRRLPTGWRGRAYVLLFRRRTGE